MTHLMFTYRTDSPYPTLPRVRVVVEPLPADDHTSPSQVTATTLPLKEWAEDWYPIPSPLPAVSGERPDRTPKPLPVTTRTQLLGHPAPTFYTASLKRHRTPPETARCGLGRDVPGH